MLALLSGASPRFCDNGPHVRLKPGKWKIEFDNVVNSTFIITLIVPLAPFEDIHEPLPIHDGFVFELKKTTLARVSFMERGTEHFVSIRAKPVSGE